MLLVVLIDRDGEKVAISIPTYLVLEDVLMCLSIGSTFGAVAANGITT